MGNGSHQLIISNCQTDVVGVVIATTNTNVGNETLYSESTLIVGKLFCWFFIRGTNIFMKNMFIDICLE